MNCQEARNLVELALDRNLSGGVKRRFDLHLSRCEDCRTFFAAEQAEHQRWFRAVNSPDEPRHSLPSGFADRLAAAVVAHAALRRPFFMRMPRWALLAASLVLMAGFVFAATVVVEIMPSRHAAPLPLSQEEDDQSVQDLNTSSKTEGVIDKSGETAGHQLPIVNAQPNGENEMNIKQKASAAIVMATMMTIASARGDVVYENDFATRTTSDLPPDGEWSEYRYGKGVALAYNFENQSSLNRYITPYSWYPAQDGWTKTFGYALLENNMFTTVTDEDDPALVFTDKDVVIGSTQTYAKDHMVAIMHPLRNVFTNGEIKLQFDIRQTASPTSAQISWLRLEEEYDMRSDTGGISAFPIELGLAGSSLSGGWRENESDADGSRVFKTFGSAQALHWYRYCVTLDLDRNVSSFEVYDLGTSRIGMDALPGGAPVVTRENCYFRRKIGSTYGGISGIMIRTSYRDTLGYYGESTYNDDLAYKYDNIKVAWKAPGAVAFTDCYRNDFSKSRRRTIDGRNGLSHTYSLADATASSTFTYVTNLVRVCTDYSINGKPFLSAPYQSGLANQPQHIGVDGWRVAGHSSYTYPMVVTTNNGNRVFTPVYTAMLKQPMCQEITSGKVRFEFDQRMPKGWNGTPRCEIDLFSAAAYDNGVNCQSDSLIRFGLSGSTDRDALVNGLRKTYSVYLSGAYKNDSFTPNFKPSTWYRLQLIIDLDLWKVDCKAFEIGANAPVRPDAVDVANLTQVAAYLNQNMLNPSGTGFKGGVAAWGLTNYQRSQDSGEGGDAAECAMLIDNVRCWKEDGNGGWTLVFVNDGSTTVRQNYTRQSLALNPDPYFDRPEWCEDGWNGCPTYNTPLRIVGNDSVLQYGEQYSSIIHSLGRNIRHGELTAQFDVRVPTYWDNSVNFSVAFGGGTMASASTATTPYRFNTHYAFTAGIGPGKSNGSSGASTRTIFFLNSGSAVSEWFATSAYEFANNWLRVKILANMDTGRFSVNWYDLGTAHPTFDTPEGEPVKSFSNAQFRFNDEPVSHFHIVGGRTPSYQPWLDDAPGSLLLDNIRVCHIKPGMTIIVR